MRSFMAIPALIVLLQPVPAKTQDFSLLVNQLRGAKLIAQDDQNTFLGTFSNAYDSDSIFNEFGRYGGPYSNTSIWNTYGTFGGQYSKLSPFNLYASTAPMIVKNGRVIAYLTANKFTNGALNPGILKAIEDQF